VTVNNSWLLAVLEGWNEDEVMDDRGGGSFVGQDKGPTVQCRIFDLFLNELTAFSLWRRA
jgi:hypothetical protein